MKNSYWWREYEWELLEALMIILWLIKWIFLAFCTWYVVWLYNQ